MTSDTFNDETRSRERKISGRRERLRRKRHALSHIFASLGNPRSGLKKRRSDENWWRRVNQRKDDDCPIAVYRGIGMASEPGGRRSTFRRIEDDRVRARSSGLGRLGLGLVTLCLVKAVDQRLNDELDRKLVDVLHVLRISVLQCTLHRIQKRFLDFLEVERLVITVIRNYKIKGFKTFQEKKSNITILLYLGQKYNSTNC